MIEKTNYRRPLQPYQAYNTVKEILGLHFLTRLENKAKSTIYKWCADPVTTAEHEPGPFNRVLAILKRLKELKYDEAAREIVLMFASEIDADIATKEVFEPDKNTVVEECLDDYNPMQRYHDAIRALEEPYIVRRHKESLEKEISETYEMYLDEFEKAKIQKEIYRREIDIEREGKCQSRIIPAELNNQNPKKGKV